MEGSTREGRSSLFYLNEERPFGDFCGAPLSGSRRCLVALKRPPR